ncbi:uncharacterized protein [Setaria viridis]
MEPNKQGDAASSKPTADLEARLHAMRLGDPSSPQLQPYHRASTSSLLLNPQQVLAPTAAPVERPPPHMPQSPPKEPAPTATPDMRLLTHRLQSQPEARSYGAVELSPGDRIRRKTCAWLFGFGVNSPSFNAPAAPTPSVPQKRSELSVSAEEYRPISLPHRSVEQSSSTPIFSASQGPTSASGPQAGATDPFSAPGGNASLNMHASALLSADQVDPRSWSRPPAIPLPLTLEEDRALCRVSQLVPGDVGSAGLSACIVRLLKEGCDMVRASVFDGVIGALHFVMGNREWSVVFIELLLARRFDELQAIVHVACEGEGFLKSIANKGYGVRSLKKLFEAVRLHAGLRQHLINCLLNEGLDLFQHRNGPDLLGSIFAMFAWEDSSIVIRHALNNSTGVLWSKFGPKSMVRCFTAARNPELQDLEKIILSHTVELAKGKFSTYFLQKVLKHGGDLLKESITERVIEHLVSLSLDKYGSHVVRACFSQMGSRRLTLLQRVFTEFRGLSDGQLARLVQNWFASLVVSDLLKAGKCESPEETVALARRIQKLPAAGLEQVDQTAPVRIVMEAVREVLS